MWLGSYDKKKFLNLPHLLNLRKVTHSVSALGIGERGFAGRGFLKNPLPVNDGDELGKPDPLG